jgi:hypothetical protein
MNEVVNPTDISELEEIERIAVELATLAWRRDSGRTRQHDRGSL